MKIELLVKRIHEIHDKKQQFKKELLETKVNNMALARMKLNLEDVNEELSEQLDKAGIMKPSGMFGFDQNRTEEM